MYKNYIIMTSTVKLSSQAFVKSVIYDIFAKYEQMYAHHAHLSNEL